MCIPLSFQHSSLTYYIPLVKDQSSFYEIRSRTICINIKAFTGISRKQRIILKAFLEYLEFYIVAFWRWFSPKSCLTNSVTRASCLQTGCLLKSVYYFHFTQKQHESIKDIYMWFLTILCILDSIKDKAWIINEI